MNSKYLIFDCDPYSSDGGLNELVFVADDFEQARVYVNNDCKGGYAQMLKIGGDGALFFVLNWNIEPPIMWPIKLGKQSREVWKENWEGHLITLRKKHLEDN